MALGSEVTPPPQRNGKKASLGPATQNLYLQQALLSPTDPESETPLQNSPLCLKNGAQRRDPCRGYQPPVLSHTSSSQKTTPRIPASLQWRPPPS